MADCSRRRQPSARTAAHLLGFLLAIYNGKLDVLLIISLHLESTSCHTYFSDPAMEKPTYNAETAKLDADDVDEERAIGGGIESATGGVRDGDLSAGDGVFAKTQRYVGSVG